MALFSAVALALTVDEEGDRIIDTQVVRSFRVPQFDSKRAIGAFSEFSEFSEAIEYCPEKLPAQQNEFHT